MIIKIISLFYIFYYFTNVITILQGFDSANVLTAKQFVLIVKLGCKH